MDTPFKSIPVILDTSAIHDETYRLGREPRKPFGSQCVQTIFNAALDCAIKCQVTKVYIASYSTEYHGPDVIRMDTHFICLPDRTMALQAIAGKPMPNIIKYDLRPLLYMPIDMLRTLVREGLDADKVKQFQQVMRDQYHGL